MVRGKMETTRIIAKESASKRTKERIKQHGPDFVICDKRTLAIFDGRECVLLRGPKPEYRKSWLGWIPIDELEKCDEN